MIKTTLAAAAAALILACAPATAQTCPTFTYNKTLTAGEWQACFDSKQPALGYTPLNRAGDTMLGRLVVAAPSGNLANFNLTPGGVPAAPNDGDMWVTTSGFFGRANGITFGPFNSVTSQITVGTTLVSSGTNGALLYNNAGVLGNQGIASFLTAGTGVTVTGTTNATIAADIANSAAVLAGTSGKVLDAAGVFQAETTSTFNATQALDFNTFYNTKVTLTASITSFSCSNQKAGQSGTIRFIQDGTGGRTLPGTMGCNMKFSNGAQPVLSTAPNAVDALVYSCSATNYCVGNLIKAVQ